MAVNSVTLLQGTTANAFDVENKVNPLYTSIDHTNMTMSDAYDFTGNVSFVGGKLLVKGAGAGVANIANANTANSRAWVLPDLGATSNFAASNRPQGWSAAQTLNSGGQFDFAAIADSLLLSSGTPTTNRSLAYINNQLNVHDGSSIRFWASIDKSSIVIHNLGLKLSAGAISITGLGNTALSASNAGWISYPSSTTSSWLCQTVTADQTIASGGIKGRWGTTASVAWGNDIPFGVYITSKDDTASGIRFFLARSSDMTTTPSSTNNIGIDGTAPSTADQGNIVLFGNAANTGYNSRPCRLIGTCRMTCDNSAGGVWTVTALDNGDGIGVLYNFGSRQFTMPTGQNGATSGKFLKDNGGTAPTFTGTNNNFYTLGLDGYCDWGVDLRNTAGGTAGAGAVSAIICAPYARLAETYANGQGVCVLQNSGTFDTNATLQPNIGGVNVEWIMVWISTLQTARTITQNGAWTNATRAIEGGVRFKAF